MAGLQVSPQLFAQGSPQKSTGGARNGALLRMRRAAVDSIIPTRIGVKPGAKGTVDMARVPAVIRRLKEQDWAFNPFALGDDDHQFLKGRLMKVVKGIMGKKHAGRVSDMTEDSFWSVLSTLVRGKVKNVQMRAKELVKKICGNPEARVMQLHDHLRTQHDLPRYMIYIRAQPVESS